MLELLETTRIVSCIVFDAGHNARPELGNGLNVQAQQLHCRNQIITKTDCEPLMAQHNDLGDKLPIQILLSGPHIARLRMHATHRQTGISDVVADLIATHLERLEIIAGEDD